MERGVKGVILDGGVAKAYRVLRARLGPLGYDVRVSPPGLPDEVLDGYRARGYVIVSTDKDALRLGWIYVPMSYARWKSARDLASHVIKLVFQRVRGGTRW